MILPSKLIHIEEGIFEVTQVKGKSVDYYIINQAIINEWGLTLLFSVILSLF